MLKIIPISALKNNYIWLIVRPDTASCVVVDPGAAEPVLSVLQKHGWNLRGILLTHHHLDHTGGVNQLLRNTSDCPVFGPAKEDIPEVTEALEGEETIQIAQVDCVFRVLSIPGHTRAHVAYYGHGILLSGDTLFTGGCGRVFEGTVEQMYTSLGRLKNLPDETKIYCGHEYTQANLTFASLVEPDNSALKNRLLETQILRAQGLPTVPNRIRVEKQTNPFLRCEVGAVRKAAQDYCGRILETEMEVFGVLRGWKNEMG